MKIEKIVKDFCLNIEFWVLTTKSSFRYQFLDWKTNTHRIWIRAPKVSFNFHFKIEMEKDIFPYFNFDFKVENWKMMKFFQFSFFNFYWKIENWKFIFHVSVFKFNCQIKQVEKSWLAFFFFFDLVSLLFFFQKRERKNSIDSVH